MRRYYIYAHPETKKIIKSIYPELKLPVNWKTISFAESMDMPAETVPETVTIYPFATLITEDTEPEKAKKRRAK